MDALQDIEEAGLFVLLGDPQYSVARPWRAGSGLMFMLAGLNDPHIHAGWVRAKEKPT